MLLRKQVSVRNGEKKLVVKRESRKYYLTDCSLRLTSDLKEWVKQHGTKFAQFIDLLSVISRIAEEFHWTE